MHLPSDLFQRVVESLATGRTTWSNERRNQPRFGLSGAVEMTPLSEGRFPLHEPVRVRDVSARGIGIISHHPLAPGSEFLLEFDARSEEDAHREPVSVVCVAQHCRPIGDRTFRVGARFLRAAERSSQLAAAA